jgi:hypothetical protein
LLPKLLYFVLVFETVPSYALDNLNKHFIKLTQIIKQREKTAKSKHVEVFLGLFWAYNCTPLENSQRPILVNLC